MPDDKPVPWEHRAEAEINENYVNVGPDTRAIVYTQLAIVEQLKELNIHLKDGHLKYIELTLEAILKRI